MDKRIVFKRATDFYTGKYDVIANQDHDDYGNEFTTFQIKKSKTEMLHFHNSNTQGLITDESEDHDLIASIMELGSQRDKDGNRIPMRKEELETFFRRFGFLFSNIGVDDNIYVRYNMKEIVDFIEYLQTLISLINKHVRYITLKDTNRNCVDYTEAANLLMKLCYSPKIKLTGYDNSGTNVSSYETEHYQLGFDYNNSYCSEIRGALYNILHTVYPEDTDFYSSMDLKHRAFEQYIDYFSKNHKKSFLIDRTQYNITMFLKKILDVHKFIYNSSYVEQDIIRVSEQDGTIAPDMPDSFSEIPSVGDINSSEYTEIQDMLMQVISMALDKQLDVFYEKIRMTSSLSNMQIKQNTSITLINLFSVISIEILDLVNGGFECRACCKEGCTMAGTYYFIIDAKNSSRTCYDRKCRIKMNKRIYDNKNKPN